MNICINREKDTKKYDVVNVVAGGIGIRRTKKTNLADRSVQKKDIPCKINTSDIFSRHIITTEKFSVYPNPVLPDSFLHFSLNDSASKKQTVEIFSAKGDLGTKRNYGTGFKFGSNSYRQVTERILYYSRYRSETTHHSFKRILRALITTRIRRGSMLLFL